METTDMQAIRVALEDAYQHFLGMRQIATGPLTLAAANMSIDKNRDALAILDKIDKSGEGEVVGWMDEDSHYSAYKHPAYPIPLVRQSAPAEVAPSPQAVTVEGILTVFADLCKETNVDLRTYGTTDKRAWVKLFRTRLDKYLNNR